MLTGRFASSFLRRARVVSSTNFALPAFSEARLFAAQATGGKGTAVSNDDREKFMRHLSDQQNAIVHEVVPWLAEQMPEAYFRHCTAEAQNDHIKAISALRGAKSEMQLNLRSFRENGTREDLTFIRPKREKGQLNTILSQVKVKEGFTLSRVQIYCSKDNELALYLVSLTSGDQVRATEADAKPILEFIDQLKTGRNKAIAYDPTIFGRVEMVQYLANCSKYYVESSSHRRFLIQRQLYEQIKGGDSVAIQLETYQGTDQAVERASESIWVTLAAGNVSPRTFTSQAVNILQSRGIDVQRLHLDTVADPSGLNPKGTVTMLRMLATPEERHPLADALRDPRSAKWDEICADLRRFKWLDDAVVDLGINKHPVLGLRRAEIAMALAHMVLSPLSKVNQYAFTRSNIIRTIGSTSRIASIVGDIADLFQDKFNPRNPLSVQEFERRSKDIMTKINDPSATEDPSIGVLLLKLLEAVDKTYRTNLYMPDRYALSLRVDPSIMFHEGDTRARPFGVFFSSGRKFFGFHNRFNDIARGGLRVVAPRTGDMHELDAIKTYDECYKLSYAQQLKNKDIPEGGSKAVVLANTAGMDERSKQYVIRKSVKGFIDSILDLVVKTPETRSHVIDFYGKEELLFIGPDENIIPDDIAWIVKRAGERGHHLPASFMSSKATNGFNHKVFGVTSEGVAVFLRRSLKSLKIDPETQSFTVKITGGPDGDVAGNMMKILIRDYGSRAKIVGVADGFGCAEDPEGLCHTELLRLFEAQLPINHFDSKQLSARGRVYDANTEEGSQMRNTMHNRVISDIFVPGGGRPDTINSKNYKKFLSADGKPSSPLIVEGANLFITPDARQKLYDEARVRIIKDSSANKCGVITSSYEVMGAFLLTEAQFVDNKTILAEQVLQKLRRMAMSEAELLFREFELYPGALPHFSQRISESINDLTERIGQHLSTVDRNSDIYKMLLPLVRDHLPEKMVQLAGGENIFHNKIPLQYIRNAMSSFLAAKIVYSEGTYFIESIPAEKRFNMCMNYVKMESEVKQLIESLKASNIPTKEKERLISLLLKGGVRSSLN